MIYPNRSNRVFAMCAGIFAGLMLWTGETAGVPTEGQKLTAARSLERSLAAGEVHRYEIDLEADESVSLEFSKHGVALMGTVLAPDGTKKLNFGSISRRQGRESVEFVSETAGTYRIVVRSNFKPSPPGTYTVRLVARQAVSAEQKGRLALQSCQEERWLDGSGNFLVDEILASMADCITAVGRKLEQSHPEALPTAAAAKTEIDYLAGRWHWGEFVSEGYQGGLRAGFEVLRQAAAEIDDKRAFRMLRDVAEDLAAKAEHCRASPRGLGADLTVSVRTLKANQEDPGWWVHYKLKIHRFTDKFNHRFPLPSSPTDQTFPAGNYWVWATSSAAESPLPHSGAVQELRVVGESGQQISFALGVR